MKINYSYFSLNCVTFHVNIYLYHWAWGSIVVKALPY